MSAAGYREVVVAYRNGSPVRLHEVARVYDGVENDKTGAHQRTTRAVFVSINRQPGANTVQIIDTIRALMPGLRAQLPAAVKLDVRSDRSSRSANRLADVEVHPHAHDGARGHGDLPLPPQRVCHRDPQPGLPVSVIGTFAVMYLARSTTASTTCR